MYIVIVCVWVPFHVFFPEECKDCHDHKDTLVTTVVHPEKESPAAKELMKERPVEEVAARLAQQDKEEQDILTCRLAIITCICIPAFTFSHIRAHGRTHTHTPGPTA